MRKWRRRGGEGGAAGGGGEYGEKNMKASLYFLNRFLVFSFFP
jgi:hypothetical protein